MRRSVLYGLLVVLAIAAGSFYWFAHRTFVVGRAVVETPPIYIPPHESMIGRPLPALEGVDEKVRGRVAVINVWAPWCRPCQQELPHIENEIWRRFGGRIAVVGIAIGEQPAGIAKFNARAHLTFPLVADPTRTMARALGANNAIPETYVVDRSGSIVYEKLGYEERSFAHVVSAVERAADRTR